MQLDRMLNSGLNELVWGGTPFPLNHYNTPNRSFMREYNIAPATINVSLGPRKSFGSVFFGQKWFLRYSSVFQIIRRQIFTNSNVRYVQSFLLQFCLTLIQKQARILGKQRYDLFIILFSYIPYRTTIWEVVEIFRFFK